MIQASRRNFLEITLGIELCKMLLEASSRIFNVCALA